MRRSFPSSPTWPSLARAYSAGLLLLVGLAAQSALLFQPAVAAQPARHAAAAPTPDLKPAKPSSFTVAVLGDGFGEALAEGLAINLGDNAGFTILEKTHAPYGLSEDERFEWPIAIANMFAERDRIDAAVIMLGVNDTRPLRDGTATIEPHTPRWTQLYGDRVEAVVAQFRTRHIPLIWVGLPIVLDPTLAANFAELNEIVRDRAVKAGATYVDSWEAFVNEAGKYSRVGPDVNGQTTKLRTADGIDLTRAGARKLASFVEADLRRERDEADKPVDPGTVVIPNQPGFDNALQIDINAQIRREAGLPPALPDQSSPAAPGPVVPITGPALSAGGQLADAADPMKPAAAAPGTLVERSLVEGQPLPPRPGRMDDFAWPRHPAQ